MPEHESFTIQLPAEIARKVRFAAEEEGVSVEACIGVGAVLHSYTTIYGSYSTGSDEPEVVAVMAANPSRPPRRKKK